ncbi:pollen allergen Phl p 11 [Cocos nucifera]|uniref:Pollen allergen Phl p 11 n=1 Tax=Cocos nucifera TaxID=13894 RepID=A0A8K0I0M9_COCNU|nr:pollen allergen Phl p 11 [Cocos nucifera]
MAKLQLLHVFVTLSLTLTDIALAHDSVTNIIGEARRTKDFVLEGRVYCDTCRTGFETDLTAYMPARSTTAPKSSLVGTVSQDGGLLSNVRQANALGYLIDEPSPECGELLQKYAFANDDD